jgi:hypothetical protein
MKTAICITERRNVFSLRNKISIREQNTITVNYIFPGYTIFIIIIITLTASLSVHEPGSNLIWGSLHNSV